MGLFSSKKKIFVSSVPYNLAGDENLRPNYLKSLMLGGILTQNNFDAGETIQSGYLQGPGMKLRSFFRWAQNNYDYIGMPKGGLISVGDLDNAVLAANIPHEADETITVSEAVYDVADFFYWADGWMLENHADIYESEWTSDFDDATGEIVITLADEVTQYRFVPADFDNTKSYIYVTYSITKAGSEGPIVAGSTVVLGSGDPWPSVVGWDAVSSVVTPRTTTLNTVVTAVASYSDGRPNETTTNTTPSTGSWDDSSKVWSMEEYQGQDPDADRLWTLKSFMNQDQTAHVEQVTTTNTTTEDIGGGVTKTTVTTTVTDTVVLDREYRIDTQDITVQSFEGPNVFIYEIGSGIPAIDAMVEVGVADEQYFPFIPVRLDNVFIDDDKFDDELYALAKKAYKKSMGGKFSELIDKIEDNENLKDIDYAYCVFGVSLNVKELTCREYLYRFFKKLMESQSWSETAYAQWEADNAEYTEAYAVWQTWKAAQANEADPLFGTDEPVVPAYPSLPSTEVSISSDGEVSESNLDMRISWQTISETTGTGLAKEGAKKDDLWFGPATTKKMFTGPWNARLIDVDTAELFWQDSATTWRKLTLVGLVHRNYVYKGKYVEISLKEALEDDEESGFIVPLHNDTYRSMPLVKSTQMATACCFIIFNCYVIKKIKWYQRSWFKIFLIIVIVAISIAFPPFGGAGAGILGSAASVGAALGFSGALALLIGTVANMVAAAILMKIIGYASTAIFGDKIGAIVAAVASVVAITVGTGMMNGGSFAQSLSSLGSASNLFNLASSVGQGVQGYVQASIADMQKSMKTFQEQMAEESEKLDDLYASNIGTDRAFFDAMSLVSHEQYYPESREVFLSRTLLTGSDNIEISLGYITNFVDATLTMDLK